MRKTQLKKEIYRELSSKNWGQFPVLFKDQPPKAVLSCLCGIIRRRDLELRHRAARSFGLVIAELARRDLAEAREIMRRLVWSLNEESGGIGWGTSEAMGEAFFSSPVLADEFGKFLISYLDRTHNYLEFTLLRQGVAWGLGRWAQRDPSHLKEKGISTGLCELLTSSDPQLKAAAAWALGWLGDKKAINPLSGLLADSTRVLIWEQDRLEEKSLSSLTQNALDRINS
ncbi:DVU0298 family protein [Dethiosulfatarculus sandiegensis]|uniref:PBS lyase n=1 Tax=Dethiosulfatarculus sandiegensis TaxID=1429043 RepID=A0A0D2J6I2_9BACT|nr:DVU0298 family protein [Dethiosulfatarculus sandiegensis]KIX13764.1 hypothetical protein X474_12710 [Dethiosulfatarculus sandiegensis]